MQFWGVSVLHCHGVFPSGDQQQQQKPLQQQEENGAKIHSSSKGKQQPRSSFSIMAAAPAECEGCGAVHSRNSMAQCGFPQFQWVDQKIFPGSAAGAAAFR